jgi:hypothetical protein
LLACRNFLLTTPIDAFVSIIPSGQNTTESTDVGSIRLTSLRQIQLLLQAASAGGLSTAFIGEDEDEDDDEDYVPEDTLPRYRRRRREASKWFEPVTEPQKAGLQLLKSGDFGRLTAQKKHNFRRSLRQREMGFKGRGKGFYKEDFSKVIQI